MLVVALSLPFVVAYLIHLMLNLLLTPFTLIGRAWFGRPWTVVAYPVGDGPEYRGQAADGDSADQLVTRVRAEITEYGTPKSLTARPMRSKWGW
ncbi:hypothetical protein ACWDV4_19440 [Micromonospora sp. NPDC003197]